MMAEKTCVKVLVEENGEHGFDSYRVPGIVTASNGDLLLTYEGREVGGNRRTLFFRRYQIKDGQPQPAGEQLRLVRVRLGVLLRGRARQAAHDEKGQGQRILALYRAGDGGGTAWLKSN